MKITQLAILLCCSFHQHTTTNGFTIHPATISTTSPASTITHSSSSSTALNAKKKKKANKKKTTTTTAGLKGFGSTTTKSATSTINVPIDRSKTALEFYSFLESNGCGSSLKRVALGFFPFTSTSTDNEDDENFIDEKNVKSNYSTKDMLRGVVALKKIPKGDVIIEIPYEAAWNLGKESSDPTLPGSIVLQEYCRYLNNDKDSGTSTGTNRRDLGPYLKMLPPYQSFDVMGSTDFFSNEALDTLQSPYEIKKETLQRREKTQLRFERDVEPMMDISLNMYQWSNDERVTEEHLRWAVWLVTSRVLTVQGDAESGDSYRLMIPLIDMCNHDRDSPHILTGRAVPGGTLKVVAGKTVEAGEQVNIVYGGGVSGNDRFIQDYGFLDVMDGGKAYDITGKILMGKTRIVEGSGARGGRPTLMPLDERERALEVLAETTLEDDLALLVNGGDDMAADVKTALEYRIGVKKALKRLGYGLIAP